MARTRKTRPSARRARPAVPPTTGDRLREGWTATLSAFGAAEAELERQLRALLRRNKITATDAAGALNQLSHRVSIERRKAVKELEARLGGLQQRLVKERRQAARMVDGAVASALASVNVPTRREVAELSRKVGELSRKVDGLRAPRRAPRRTARPAARTRTAAARA